MMKRILASLLALALVVALAACGYGTSATVSSDNEPINTQDDYDSQYENAPSVEAFVEQESDEVFTDPAPAEARRRILCKRYSTKSRMAL